MVVASTLPGWGWSEWVSLLAVGIALGSVWVATRTDKVNRLTDIHIRLLQEEVQQGRKYLYQHWRRYGGFSKLRNDPEEWNKVNRALAMYDALGYYHHRGWLPQNYFGRGILRHKTVMDIWGPPLVQISEPALAFVAFRDENEEGWPDGALGRWPWMRGLFEDAKRYLDETGIPAEPPPRVE